MKKINNPLPVFNIQDKIIPLRGQYVLLDVDVATIYGVETKRINEAVRNNPEKFPKGYVFDLQSTEKQEVVENFDHLSSLKFSPVMPHAFTEKGLYMLATILKSPTATQATLLIVETFAKVRSLKQELLSMQNTLQNGDVAPQEQKTMIQRFGETLSDIVMPDLQPYEAAAEIEVNFFIGKLKYTVKRRKEPDRPDTVE
ncbi:MAG: ORF6N domain-containing protein [Bacteroides sp.]|nr:ORF6N domain-containing protein [Ruminococcus flavefaciens]MCM1554437.1 ORF6N domain-containing protein [Bacteroides sp.]